MPFQPRENAEPISGYLLKDRLGIGGYGEVWRVSAPGGLTKAIKFVYGRMDDERAARELKALGRIKEVRHPFLLSLERFDVLDGQLIVVTELADMSLMDRYRQCRDEGLPGIPRDELLGYLRDAADALDYMSEKYGLQHLDIKPENLLLVGGRVKVADFGLVKDLQDAHATAIGGVTPLYATPEAFDGKASRQSDQYSLAIVYQEMLTGVLPFPGFTTAQLAVQHMHSSPLLGPLPEADRPTIARALSKKPEERFASCRQMVDRLLGGEPKSLQRAPSRPAQAAADGEAATGACTDRSTIDLRSTPCGSHLDETSNAGASPGVHEIETEEHDLPELPAAALDLPPGAAGVRPTIFIGVGGTAERILRQLRRRLHHRYGDRSAMPCFQMLLLDTDPHTLRSAEQGDPEDALNPDETLFLPLRKPADYRGASDKILGWLSRRWLYNIPRSLRTEGLRPLGRLAYVDHADQVQDRLRQVLADATSPEAKARSIETPGGKLRSETPRVFLISSISGGAGSGMLLDLGYAARSVLREAGFDSDGVCGVMTHSTLNKSAANDLRKANAYATLTELHYYNHCGGGFREGAASILPAAELSEAPFADSYLVNLGENLSEAELEAACGAVSRYLYLDAATGCGAALDHCRETARQRIQSEDGVPRLRSFAIHTIGCDKHAVANAQADLLCHRLVGGWHSDEQLHRRPEKPELEIDELIQRLYAAADKALGGNADAQFRALVDQALLGQAAAATADEQNGGPYAAALERIHSLLGAPAIPNQPSPSGPTRVEAAIQESAKKLAGALSGSIVKSVTALVEDPRGRLPVALLAVNMFQEQLRELRQNADDVFRRSCSDSATLRTKLQRGDVGGHAPRWLSLWGGKGRQGPEERLVEYCRWRLRTIVFQHLSSLLQGVSGTVSALNEQLAQLRPRLEQLARSFASTVSAMEGGIAQPASVLAGSRDAKSQSTRLASAEFLLAFDQRFQQEVLAPQGGLLSLAAAGNEEWKKLRTQLQLYARESVLVSLKEVDAARLLVERYPQEEQLAKQLASALEKAGPRLPLSRTAKRSLAVVPQGASGEAVTRAIEHGLPNVALTVVDADSDLVFCQEAEYMSLAKAAAALIEWRPPYAAAARRVLTRLDVPWSSLPLAKDPKALVEAAAPEPVGQGV